jgi:hypothetical protein
MRLFLLAANPNDAWLAFRITTWALLLPALKRLVPLKSLVPFLWSTPKANRNPDREEKIAAVVRWITVFLYRNDKTCLERSLLLYHFLSKSNSNPLLVTGMLRTEEQNWKGHAWIVVDGKPFDEPENSVEAFKTLMVYGARGQLSENGG